jgi:hypothetical protein
MDSECQESTTPGASMDIRDFRVDHWTVVTSVFKEVAIDVCPEGILSLPVNLVIFCDSESCDAIRHIRPPELKEKTHYIIRNLDDFHFSDRQETFAQYIKDVRLNRVHNPYNFDPRVSPAYYLFTVGKHTMLKEVININVFGSTHFAYIKIEVPTTFAGMAEALETNRDKFSACYIDYIPERVVRNMKEYFQWGRCSMASGFITGSKEMMYRVCDLVEQKFIYYKRLGFGHSDEQLYSPVFFDHPDLFEHYYGDYGQVITNYKYVREDPAAPIRNFVANSFENRDYAKCLEACEFIRQSLDKGTCLLGDEMRTRLDNYYEKSIEAVGKHTEG